MDQPPCMGATTSSLSPSASAVAERAAVATKRPFSAVAIFLPPYPSSSSASASVGGLTSCCSPLTKIRIVHLHEIGHLPRHRRRQQEAMAKKTVDQQPSRSAAHGGKIVRKGRAKVGTDLHDLGLAKRRMQRIRG